MESNASSSRGFAALLKGFEASGSWYDKTAFEIRDAPGMGAGLFASRDLPVSFCPRPHQLLIEQADTPLFRVNKLLTDDSSTLREKLTDDEWESLAIGWARLILVMMWESSRGPDSPFHWYLCRLATACKNAHTSSQHADDVQHPDTLVTRGKRFTGWNQH